MNPLQTWYGEVARLNRSCEESLQFALRMAGGWGRAPLNEMVRTLRDRSFLESAGLWAGEPFRDACLKRCDTEHPAVVAENTQAAQMGRSLV